MKIALCTELRNVEWFESRLRSLFDLSLIHISEPTRPY